MARAVFDDRFATLISWFEMESRPQYLQFLELQSGCTEAEVRAAYKRLAHHYHPDQGGDAERFRQLTQHYEQAMEYVRTRKPAPEEFRIVEIDGFQFVQTNEGRLAPYRKPLLAALIAALCLAWIYAVFTPALIILASISIILLPSVSGYISPLITGGLFAVLTISLFVFAIVGTQAGLFSEEGIGFEVAFACLSLATVMSFFPWVMSLIDR